MLMSSRGSTLDDEKLFSCYRYFVNNLDSYHGKHILKLLVQLSEKNAEATTPVASMTEFGEDGAPSGPSYEIIGTVSDGNIQKLDGVSRIIPKKGYLQHMLTCGWVILDISCDKTEVNMAMEYIKLLNKLFEKLPSASADVGAGDTEKRYLILISTVMTWSITKPLDPETPDMPFVETDFRKRKPLDTYKTHFDCENEVILLARNYKSLIGALVVGVGVTYGSGEDLLYNWFQNAWQNEPLMPVLGRGNNSVPIINVRDLAQVIYNLINDFPRKLYILAVEQNVIKQKEIIKPLGRLFGTGMFKCIPTQDALLIPEISQRALDLMTVNLNMEPTYIVETMGLQWLSELTFAENLPTLMKEFTKARGLKPFRILVYGPPLVGKTTLAKRICENYGLIYISYETIVQDTIDDLTWRITQWERGETAALPVIGEEEIEEEEDQDEDMKETARQTLAWLASGAPVSDEDVKGYLRQRLLKHDALNRGWVLDGYPTNLEQCNELFEKGEEPDSEPEEVEPEEDGYFEEDNELFEGVLRKILPTLVVSLEASDDFIIKKAMKEPESADIRMDEAHFLGRLNEFRARDGRLVTPLNFFDERDIHPLVVAVSEHDDYAMKDAYAAVTLRMGRPCRYGKLLAAIEASEKSEKKALDALRLKEEKALKELEQKMLREREDKMEYWSELYGLVREEEEEALSAAAAPLRGYLMKYIFPALTPALLQVAEARPDDPIDYLAEYLFKKNPTGKMLEPGYNLQAERLLGKIKILDDALLDLDIKIDPLAPPEAAIDESNLTDQELMGCKAGKS